MLSHVLQFPDFTISINQRKVIKLVIVTVLAMREDPTLKSEQLTIINAKCPNVRPKTSFPESQEVQDFQEETYNSKKSN